MNLRAVAVGALTLLVLVVAGCVKANVSTPPVDLVVGRAARHDVEVDDHASGHPGTSPTWDAKDEVDVEWRGRWWPATVIERKGATRYLVHYEGYGEDWDEIVGPERIRLRTSETGRDDDDPALTESDP